MENLWQHSELLARYYRLDSRYYGHIYSGGTAFVDKVKKLAVVKEHLCHNIVGTRINLVLKPKHVKLGVWGFVMLFRIAGNSVAERGLCYNFHFSAVKKQPSVERVYLQGEVACMGVSVVVWLKGRLVFGFVSAKNQQVGDAEEVQVNKRVLGFNL